MQRLLKKNENRLARSFNFMSVSDFIDRISLIDLDIKVITEVCLLPRSKLRNWQVCRLRAKLYDKKMISFFPLWTSHLYVGTFKQHLYMEYLSLSWSNTGIPDCVVSIMISLIEGCCLQNFCVMFCRLPFVLFCFLHCIVWPSMNYGFWLPLWRLQIFLDVLLHYMFIFRVIQATRANFSQ